MRQEDRELAIQILELWKMASWMPVPELGPPTAFVPKYDLPILEDYSK